MSRVIALAGNPNCGKTTVFNALTGSRQSVGNWPGVTVEKKEGRVSLGGEDIQGVDLPGVYMLGGLSAGSPDERVARDFLLSREASLIINIVDAGNLERNLYLTSQLLEMGLPLVIGLNMMDMADRQGLGIDTKALEQALGCPVVPLVANRGKGIRELKERLSRTPPASSQRPSLPPEITQAIAVLRPQIARAAPQLDAGWTALKLLEGDAFAADLLPSSLRAEVAPLSAQIEAEAGEEADILIADSRFGFIATVMEAATTRRRRMSKSVSARIDQVVLNRFLGVPVFLFILYLMFLFTINVGGVFVDFFDQVFAAFLVDALPALLSEAGVPALGVALAQGVGSGLQTVATFVPIIACLFLFLAFLEDSGYMARAAFVMDRAMRAIGLPGKSFVPLIVGFGCNVPSIMATRTLENRRDRLLTIMMTPFVSCGARLPVFVLFAAVFFPENGQNIVFALYLSGLGFAIATGLLLKATLLPGEPTRFVMELPPYHLPTARGIGMQAWQRLRGFLFRAGKVIVPMVMLLSVLNTLGTDGSLGKEDTEESVLAAASRALTPIFHPMGLTDDNWPAAVGLFTGIFAKEAVVGTLNALYARVDTAPDAEDGTEPSLSEKLQEALATIPEGFAGLGASLTDPLGLGAARQTDLESAAATLDVDESVFGAMASRFDGAAGAFAYMLLILLYTPCVAASGAIRQEAGGAWTAFAALWTTVLGYSAAVVVYQSAQITRDPWSAGAWIAGILGFLGLMGAVMAAVGRHPRSPLLVP
ncbi:Fe(2+) transporter permease subunit FeoB [Pararhodospirillum photometricum]|uniref:Ferrous iron transport protein B n=1 Tax=Pararhodospirillum photometricum DSM 122 TaxID=1150469 RepID=H6SM56_PARPM|nr:Fe(2+) transporter permease subunit FeoB [Pararhodospirillum photometricum]CCG09071.1 Fe2+ transport system protein B [Pararhodospirillum photometricum DSM 122]